MSDLRGRRKNSLPLLRGFWVTTEETMMTRDELQERISVIDQRLDFIYESLDLTLDREMVELEMLACSLLREHRVLSRALEVGLTV